MKNLKISALLLFFYSAFHAQVDSVYTGVPATTPTAKPQKPKNDEWKKNVTFGGNFQVWLGNPTFLFLSPTVGYNVQKNLNVGVGVIYNYTSADYGAYGKYSQSVFGGHSYVRYIVTQGIFLQLQYDKLHQPDFLSSSPEIKKVWVDYILFGGGFRQSLGDHAALTTAIMYNLTPSPLSIYYPNRVIIQFGITAGF